MFKRRMPIGVETASDERLREFVNESQVVADRLQAALEEVTQATATLSEIAEASIQGEEQLRARSQVVMERVDETFTAMQQVRTAADQVLASSAAMLEESKLTRNTALDVCRSMTVTDRVMQELHDNSDTMQKRIQDLTNHTSKIEEINDFISEVVSQTSLLALNAAIEAARAGEQGRGFAVVAQEIKKLASQSHEAVSRSSQILNAIETGVAQVVEAVSEEKQAVAQGIEEMKRMKEKMDAILLLITNVNSLVGGTNAATDQQAMLIERSGDKLREVVELMNDTMHSVNFTLAQMRRQRKEIGTLERVKLNLDRSSGELIRSIQAFGFDVSNDNEHISSVSLGDIPNLLEQLVLHPGIRSLDDEEHASLLTAAKNRTAEVEAIWSNRADGSFIFSLPEAGLMNAKGREWWRRAMAGDAYRSPVYISAITKRPCLTISRAIVSETGEAVGVIGIDIIIKK